MSFNYPNKKMRAGLTAKHKARAVIVRQVALCMNDILYGELTRSPAYGSIALYNHVIHQLEIPRNCKSLAEYIRLLLQQYYYK